MFDGCLVYFIHCLIGSPSRQELAYLDNSYLRATEDALVVMKDIQKNLFMCII